MGPLKLIGQTIGVILFLLVLLELRLRIVDDEKEGLKSEKKQTILILGDSITKEMTPGGSYSKALQTLLDGVPACSKFQVVEKGLAGAETRDLAVQVDSLLQRFKPTIVMTMIGGADRIIWPEESLKFRIYVALRELRVFRLAQLLLWNHWMPMGLDRSLLKLNSPQNLETKFNEYYSSGVDNPDYTHSFGAHLRNEKKFDLAEKYHQKILEKYPAHNAAKIELGYVWKELGKNKESERVFQEAIQKAETSIDKSDDYTWGYIGLAELYGENFNDWRKSSKVLQRAIERLPDWHFLYLFQAKAHSKLGDLKNLEKVLKVGIEKSPNEYRLYFQLADFYRNQGRDGEAKSIMALGKKVRSLDATKGETKKWYQKMHATIRHSGAKHYALSYPLRPSEFLTELLEPDQQVTIVANDKIYKEANSVYADYFIDEFGGDFGHLTPKAARVVAENIFEKMKQEKECE